MRIKIISALLILFLAATHLHAMDAKIIRLSGKVKYRQGVEETWHTAYAGIVLKEIDTILTGEGGEVILEIQDGLTFRLGANAILDIADLRKITEQELFLYLTRQKIERIEKGAEKTPLKVSNVSAIHGTSKDTLDRKPSVAADNLWEQEKNGARALLNQQYYPNSVMKLLRILNRYPNVQDCGELHSYLGQSFEALDQPGQATDAYQTVIQQGEKEDCKNSKWIEIARQGLERLKQ
jgi:hypothetical protein